MMKYFALTGGAVLMTNTSVSSYVQTLDMDYMENVMEILVAAMVKLAE